MMKVKEVIKLAAENLGRQDLSDEIDALEDEPKEELKSLVRCFNLVENEVALDYFPLKKEESFVPVSGYVSYTDFTSSPIDVHKVTDGNGNPVDFDICPANLRVHAPCKEVKVTYSYAPVQKTLEDESDFSGRISARLLSFGVAGEFCLTASRFAEAAAWERRFLDALKAANLIRRKLCMRSRRWL